MPYLYLYAILLSALQEKVKLKYKLTYLANGATVTDTGDVTNFPLL